MWFCDPVMCIQPISILKTKTFVKSYFPHLLGIHYICLRTYWMTDSLNMQRKEKQTFTWTSWIVFIWQSGQSFGLNLYSQSHGTKADIDDVIMMQSQISFLILNNCFLRWRNTAIHIIFFPLNYVVITRSFLVITRSFLVITRSFLVITRSFLVITRSFLVITRYFLVITRSFLVKTTSFLVITTSFLLKTTYFLVITTSFLVITTSFLVITTSFLVKTTYVSR